MFGNPHLSTVHDAFSSSQFYVGGNILEHLGTFRLSQPTWCKLTIYISPLVPSNGRSLGTPQEIRLETMLGPSDCHRQSSRCSWQLCNALVVRSSRWSAEKRKQQKNGRPKNWAWKLWKKVWKIPEMWKSCDHFSDFSRGRGAREAAQGFVTVSCDQSSFFHHETEEKGECLLLTKNPRMHATPQHLRL